MSEIFSSTIELFKNEPSNKRTYIALAISRLFNGKKMSQTTDTATVISPDHPKPESQSIIRTQPLKGHQTH